MNWNDITEHPVSLLAGLLGAVGIAVKPGVLLAGLTTVWGSAGTLFTGLSVLSFTVAPNVAALEPYQGVLQTLALAAAVLFLLKLGNRTYENFERNL